MHGRSRVQDFLFPVVEASGFCVCIWEFLWQLKQYRIYSPLLLFLCTVPHQWASEVAQGILSSSVDWEAELGEMNS